MKSSIGRKNNSGSILAALLKTAGALIVSLFVMYSGVMLKRDGGPDLSFGQQAVSVSIRSHVASNILGDCFTASGRRLLLF